MWKAAISSHLTGNETEPSVSVGVGQWSCNKYAQAGKGLRTIEEPVADFAPPEAGMYESK